MTHTYVVYITFYLGNLMPPFYIGYTTKAKISKGYNGTVSSKKYKAIWQQERRDNPHLFKTEILSHHETDEEALLREEALHRFYDVPNNPAFINMAISRKGFGASGSNNPLFGTHPTKDTIEKRRSSLKGKHQSKESNEKNRKSHLGKTPSNKGKPHTKETRLKISSSHMGCGKGIPRSEEHKKKISLGGIGKHSGTHNPYKKITCPYCDLTGGSANMKRYHFDNCHFFLKLTPPSTS